MSNFVYHICAEKDWRQAQGGEALFGRGANLAKWASDVLRLLHKSSIELQDALQAKTKRRPPQIQEESRL